MSANAEATGCEAAPAAATITSKRTLRARAAPAATTEATATPKKRQRASQSPSVMERVRASAGFAFYVDLVDRLFDRPEAGHFRAPVTELWSADDLPGYFDMIEAPMDLGTVKKRLQEGHYNRYHPTTPHLDEDSVVADIRLVFRNCMTYNEPGSPVFEGARRLLQLANRAAKTRASMRRDEERVREEMVRERRLQKERERRARLKAEKEAAAVLERRKLEEDHAKREMEVKRLRKKEREADRRRELKIRQRKIACEAERNARVRTASEASDESDFEMARRKRVRVRESLQNGPCARVQTMVAVNEECELVLTFVSARGRTKRRVRSPHLMALEERHHELMQRRAQLVEAKLELERRRHVLLTEQEKAEVCRRVGSLDFVEMRAVLRMVAEGMGRMDLLQLNEIDIDVDRMDTRVLREIQLFLQQPTLANPARSLLQVDSELAHVESEYVEIRYEPQHPPSHKCPAAQARRQLPKCAAARPKQQQTAGQTQQPLRQNVRE